MSNIISEPLFKVEWEYVQDMVQPIEDVAMISSNDILECPVALSDPDKMIILFKELIAERINVLPDFIYIKHIEDLRK